MSAHTLQYEPCVAESTCSVDKQVDNSLNSLFKHVFLYFEKLSKQVSNNVAMQSV